MSSPSHLVRRAINHKHRPETAMAPVPKGPYQPTVTPLYHTISGGGIGSPPAASVPARQPLPALPQRPVEQTPLSPLYPQQTIPTSAKISTPAPTQPSNFPPRSEHSAFHELMRKHDSLAAMRGRIEYQAASAADGREKGGY